MLCGIVLPVSIVVHCCIKYSLKISAFVAKSNTNISFSTSEVSGVLIVWLYLINF